jgi:transcriptional regulator with XRE-family HTH domain
MPISDIQQKRLFALGLRVKDIRTQKGLTQKELAHSIDKDPQSIHRLEIGAINPSFLYLLDISKGLAIDISELLKDLQMP